MLQTSVESYVEIAQLKNNSLFNQISGYKPTGGIIGSFFNMIGDAVEKMSGLTDQQSDQLVHNLESCRKYFKLKEQNKTVPNVFSKFGDIVQLDNNTFVDCSRSLVGL